MANLMFTQIRSHFEGTLGYITDKDKIIGDQVYDTYRVLNYMGSEQSVERVYTFARHCSQSPAMAAQELKLHQKLYYQSKQNAKPKEGELLGLHFILSYTIGDNPSVEAMSDIMRRLAEHPLLRDFATLGAHHWDKPHRHSHWYTHQFSAVGKPRKMGLKIDDIYELMRFSNRLSVEHGLSVIDNRILRTDQEYSDWLDRVIAEGRVIVHPEKKRKRNRSKKQGPIKNHYYRWMHQNREQAEAEASMLTERQRDKKAFEDTYFYTTDGNANRRWYVSGDPRHRFYVVPRVSTEGYLRSPLELVIRFALRIVKCEGDYIRHEDPETWLRFHAKVDKKLQGMYDYMTTATQLNIQKPEQIAGRLTDIGKQMNTLRREKSRHEKSIERHEQIIAAYETYTRIRTLVENVHEPAQEAVCEYKVAYAILAHNQILTSEAYYKLCRRYDFERQKVVDYDRRLPELNRQYRELKKLEAMAVHVTEYIHEVYRYSEMAHERAIEREQGNKDVDSLLKNARIKAVEKKVSKDNEKEKE